MKGTAEANRLNASGVASKECVLRVHLVPALGRNKPLDHDSERTTRVGRAQTSSPQGRVRVSGVTDVGCAVGAAKDVEEGRHRWCPSTRPSGSPASDIPYILNRCSSGTRESRSQRGETRSVVR